MSTSNLKSQLIRLYRHSRPLFALLLVVALAVVVYGCFWSRKVDAGIIAAVADRELPTIYDLPWSPSDVFETRFVFMSGQKSLTAEEKRVAVVRLEGVRQLREQFARLLWGLTFLLQMIATFLAIWCAAGIIKSQSTPRCGLKSHVGWTLICMLLVPVPLLTGYLPYQKDVENWDLMEEIVARPRLVGPMDRADANRVKELRTNEGEILYLGLDLVGKLQRRAFWKVSGKSIIIIVDILAGLTLSLIFLGCISLGYLTATPISSEGTHWDRRKLLEARFRQLQQMLDFSSLTLAIAVVQIQCQYRWVALVLCPPSLDESAWKPALHAFTDITFAGGLLFSAILAITFGVSAYLLKQQADEFNAENTFDPFVTPALRELMPDIGKILSPAALAPLAILLSQ